jgi:hypothetical protein
MAKSFGVAFPVAAASFVGTFLVWACDSAQKQVQTPITPVLDCTGAYDVNAIFPPLAPDGGPVLEALGSILGQFAGGGPDSGPAFSDPRARRRAAEVCACRARRNRGQSDTASTWANILAITGGAGTIGGGVLNGVSATGVDDTTRKTLLSTGIITMGIGALAFGAGTALALTKTASSFGSAASDQEYAAAVLWNDSAAPTDWDRAWSACVVAEGSDKPLLPENPAASFSFDAGLAVAVDAGAPAAAEAGAGSSHVNSLVDSVPTATIDAGKK